MGAYGGKLVEWAKLVGGWSLELVRRPAGQHTFQVLPRRWVVERTFGWFNLQRRLSKDYEALCEITENLAVHRYDRTDPTATRSPCYFLDTLLEIEISADSYRWLVHPWVCPCLHRVARAFPGCRIRHNGCIPARAGGIDGVFPVGKVPAEKLFPRQVPQLNRRGNRNSGGRHAGGRLSWRGGVREATGSSSDWSGHKTTWVRDPVMGVLTVDLYPCASGVGSPAHVGRGAA